MQGIACSRHSKQRSLAGMWDSCREVKKGQASSGLRVTVENLESHNEGFNFGGGRGHLLWTFSSICLISTKPVSLMFG